MSQSFTYRIGDYPPPSSARIDADLLEMIRKAAPMTPEQLFEQKVSFVFGQIGGSITKDEVRRMLLEQAAGSPQERRE